MHATTTTIHGVFATTMRLSSRPFRAGELARVLTVHVTAVRGGFGVADYQARRWAGKKSPVKGITDARRIALLERYSGVAYHDIYSREAGDVAVHPSGLRTSHGNRGNIGLGWAADCHPDDSLDAAFVAGARASLERAIAVLHGTGSGEPVIVVPHRAWSSQRLSDPGADVWRRIIRPSVTACSSEIAVIGYNTRADSGRPVPRSWDPSALFDDRGRRLV